jgi:glycosyltransferase involved in cell wall biosynthesis
MSNALGVQRQKIAVQEWAANHPIGQLYEEVAVLIPCYNEEITVGKVVTDFQRALPGARVFVFDNNSTDKTKHLAREAGATVVHVSHQGKGNVVKQMFEQVNADVYLLVDADDTYSASEAPKLIEEHKMSGADMVVGIRTAFSGEVPFRRFHKFGNHLVARLISLLFSTKVTDVLSGYRVFSKAFVKTVPVMSTGFEIETEMTLQALAKSFVIKEIPVQYGTRPEGSHSKLNTFADGYLVLRLIFLIFKDFKPLAFFSLLSALLCILAVVAGFFPVRDYIEYRYVYHVPLAILATGTGILAALSFCIGVILETIAQYQNENFQLLRRLLQR